jgi:26S proteasome regulatory subunit N2
LHFLQRTCFLINSICFCLFGFTCHYFYYQVDSTAEKKAPEPEATFQILVNPARVLPAQEKFIRFIEDSRYVPVRPAPSGFILLRDTQPTEPEELVLTDAPATVVSSTGNAAAAAGQPAAMAVDDEPQPPQPFEYTS